jgi:hypothetical protein
MRECTINERPRFEGRYEDIYGILATGTVMQGNARTFANSLETMYDTRRLVAILLLVCLLLRPYILILCAHSPVKP